MTSLKNSEWNTFVSVELLGSLLQLHFVHFCSVAADTSEKETIEYEKERKQKQQTQERKEWIQHAKIGGCSKLQNLSSRHL